MASNDAYPIRTTNRDRMLGRVVNLPGQSRAALSAFLGLSRSAGASIVSDLIDEGLLREGALAATDRRLGRSSTGIYPAMPSGAVLALDFGHRHVAVALADLEGKLLGKYRALFDVDHNAIGAVDHACQLVRSLLEDARTDIKSVSATVASIPGPIDSRTGIVRSPTILSGWIGLDPAKEIGRRIGTDVTVFNDANLGAWGERVYGAGRDFRDFVYVKASDGIGAGLVIAGEIYDGSDGLSGEIGHTLVDSENTLCRCGNSGCIEVIASSSAVRARLMFTHPAVTAEQPLASLTDPVSERIFSDAGRSLGRIVADMCNLLNPSAVIIGGELGEVGEPFVAGIREMIDRIAQPATASSVRVLSASLGRDAELMGAVARSLAIGRQLRFSAVM